MSENPFKKVDRHLRQYTALYAFVTAWVVMLALFPTINRSRLATNAPTANVSAGAGPQQPGAATTRPGSAPTATAPGAPAPAGGQVPTAGGTVVAGAPAGGNTAAGGSSAGSGGGTVATPEGTAGADGGTAPAATDDGSTEAAPGAPVAAGVARSGVQCDAGVRQVAGSDYAAPCAPAFAGDNGGATNRGVTADTIKIVLRIFSDASGPNGQTTDEANKAAGRADRKTAWEIFQVYGEYFNKNYELYGRQVVFDTYEGQGNYTNEAQSKGQEQACADATALADSKQAFGVIGYHPLLIETEPFAECAAQKGLFVPIGASYFPETYYQRWHPYVWHFVMSCERIAHDVSEYIGKRLGTKNARWAGDPTYQATGRKYGMYIPDNEGYQICGNIIEADLKEQYGITLARRVNYQLDVARFPEQAASAAVQFKAAGVTTLIKTMDAVSSIFLTQAADAQQWRPEWLIIGVATQDTDGSARLMSQPQVDGHMFGMSQLGAEAKMNDKNGEAYQAWKAVRPDQEPPTGYGFIYYEALHMFNLLQAGGPNLSPHSIADGIKTFPPGGGDTGAFGTWSLADDHTAIDDSREVFWDGSATGYDGKAGAFIETYGGRRFASGQWPSEDPPIYPGRQP